MEISPRSDFIFSIRGRKISRSKIRATKPVKLRNNYRENCRGKGIHLHGILYPRTNPMKIEKRLKKRFPSIEYSIQPLFLVSNIPSRGRNESFADGRNKSPMRYLCELLVRVGETEKLVEKLTRNTARIRGCIIEFKKVARLSRRSLIARKTLRQSLRVFGKTTLANSPTLRY